MQIVRKTTIVAKKSHTRPKPRRIGRILCGTLTSIVSSPRDDWSCLISLPGGASLEHPVNDHVGDFGLRDLDPALGAAWIFRVPLVCSPSKGWVRLLYFLKLNAADVISCI